MTLTEFLLARIAEDEAAARSVDAEYRAERARDRTPTPVEPDLGLYESETRGYPSLVVGVDRVLAECEAKRRIVERCQPYDNMQVRRQTRSLAGDTLRDLALPYADHADFQEEWRP